MTGRAVSTASATAHLLPRCGGWPSRLRCWSQRLAAQTNGRNGMAIRDERGITTAEYAVGTAAGAGLAMLLFKMLTGSFGEDMLHTLFNHVMQMLGM